MQQAEEAAAESKPECAGDFRLVVKRGVVETQLRERVPEFLVVLGVDREEACEDARLDRLEPRDRLGALPVLQGDGVTYRRAIDLLDARDHEADVPALEQLASVLSDIGDARRLEPVVQRLVKEAPKNTWSHYYAASLFFIQGRLDMALQAARNSVALDPSNAKAHNLIGACLASMGQTDAARTAFETSIKADPREPGTYANLATLELQSANRDKARKYFAEALTIDPNHQAARDGLATVMANPSR